jgi:hypothetical protein
MTVSTQPPMITPTHAADPNHALQKVRRSPEAQSDNAAMLVVLPDSVCNVLPTTRSVAKSTCSARSAATLRQYGGGERKAANAVHYLVVRVHGDQEVAHSIPRWTNQKEGSATIAIGQLPKGWVD